MGEMCYLIGGPADLTKMEYTEAPAKIQVPVSDRDREVHYAVYLPIKQTKYGVVYEWLEHARA